MDTLKAKTYVPCPVCGSEKMEFLGYARTEKILFLKIPFSICRDCGFLLVNPRWTPDQYDQVMNLWYVYKFKKDPPNDHDQTKRFSKWKVMDDRILSRFYPNGVKNLLDVGAGQGWCIEYLKTKYPGLNAYAIERWPACQEHIEKEYGGKILGEEITGEWDRRYENHFDLVVLRHTLEHLLDPKIVLNQINKFLSDSGYAYIVVPSIREIPKRMIFHDFIRPCHLSYFCKETLLSITKQAGLLPVVLEEAGQGEVWGLFKKGKFEFEKPDVYQASKNIISALKRKDRYKSLRLLTGIYKADLMRILFRH